MIGEWLRFGLCAAFMLAGLFIMVVSILSMACWRLGFSYLLCVRMGWGAVGVWVAMVIDWTCRVTCFVLRFRSGAWKTKYQA